MSGLQRAANIPELRKRILFTLIMLAVYRVGVEIPTPGINGDALAAFFEKNGGTLFGMFNMFSGGALENFSIFALGIMPYISASIIIQLLTVVVPQLEALKKEGESGRRKITQYTRYGTVLLSIVQGMFIAVGLEVWPARAERRLFCNRV
jgi:preprotein translocase subunit SecY